MPTPTPPFSHLMVPYDGSEPAQAALRLAIRAASGGAAITVVTIVDETPIISQSATTVAIYDPTPLMEALDAEGQALLDDAAAQCRAAGLEPVLTAIHERPVAGILAAADAAPCDLIVMGTHARTGVARTFLGSTTEGVLRGSTTPVLTVRSIDRVAEAPFATVLVAVDDSEPADAALALAARLARTAGTHVVACHVTETTRTLESAADLSFGLASERLSEELHADAASIVNGALTRAGLPEDTPVVIADGDPAEALVAAAAERGAGVIVAGTHGRRGISRLVLGSVAESIVRSSPIPVLVVPAHHRGASSARS